MKWLPPLLTLVLIVGIGAGCGSSALRHFQSASQPSSSQPTAVPQEGSTNPMMRTLSNGMKLLIHQTPQVGVATADVWVATGAADETPEMAGVSHFLEHMLFKGTEHSAPGEMDQLVEGCGGILNAGTSKDFTHYFMTVPAERISTAIDAMGDAVTSSTLVTGEFDKERGVILEEISRKEDSPFGFLFEKVYETAFVKGPYRHSVLGSDASIRAMTRDRMFDYYRNHYTASNMTLVIAGEVKPEDVVQWAEKAFAPLGAQPSSRPNGASSEWNDGATAAFEKDVREIYSAVAFPAPGFAEADATHSADVLQAILSTGRASRLVREIKERRGLVSSIAANYSTHRRDGMFVIYATVPSEKFEEYRRELQQELERAGDEKPSGDTLERAKKLLINGHHFAKETTGGAASTLGYYLTMTGSTEFEERYVQRVEAVSSADVRDMAKRIFDPIRAIWVTVTPKLAEGI